MGYPWGKAPLADGTGTTPTDMQRVIGSQFLSPGVLPDGGLTVEGTSSMAYKVNPGAAFLWTDSVARLGVLIPVEGTTVNTAPAPSTGSRIDTVYVTKDGAVGVVEGTTIPGGGVSVGRFTVPAGITGTSSAQPSLDRNFAIPVGASLGRLHSFHDPANGVKGNVSAMTLGSGRFFLPSDRLVRFDMTHCISAIQDPDPDVESSAIRWRVYIDNVLELAFTTRASWANPQTNFLSFSKSLSEGSHTVHYVQDTLEGALGWMHHKGGPDAYPGNRFEVWDAGVSR